MTADVTTITYTDAKFTSTEQYQTEAERDAAAAAKEKDLKDAAGKDVTVTGTEKTDYTYTGNGTYIPTFTKTVNVKDEEVEWKHTDKKTDYGVRTEEEAVAKVTKEQEKALSNKINDDDDLYLIGVSSDLKVTGYTEDHWYDDSDFLVSGTVSATYAKVTKKTVDQSTFGSLWNDIKALFGKGEATNKKLEDAARKAVEADGGIFVSANWDDWKFGKATIRYVAGVSVKTDEKTTAADAQNAVQDAALAQANAIMTGWHIGAGELEECDRGTKRAAFVGVCVAVCMETAIVLGSGFIMPLFTDNPEMTALVRKLLAIDIVLEIGRVTNLVFGQALKTSGDAVFPAVIAAVFMFVFAVGGTWLFGISMGLMAVGAYIGLASDECVRAVGMVWRWKTGKWRTKKLV